MKSRNLHRVSHLGFKIAKKRRSNIQRIHRRCFVLPFEDYNSSKMSNKRKRDESYEHCNNMNECDDSTQCLADFIIPGDIPGDIQNYSYVFGEEVFSEYFGKESTFDDRKNNEQFELQDSTESIVELVILGDIPPMESLMITNIYSLEDFFTDI